MITLSAQTKRILLILAFIVIIIALAFLGYQAYTNYSSSSVPRFSIFTNKTLHWYSIDGTKIKVVQGPASYDSYSPQIYQTADKLPSRDIPVLAKGTFGGVELGIIRNTIPFIPVLPQDVIQRIGITDRPDGMVVYSENVATTSPIAAQNGNWTLISYPLYGTSPKPLMLGPGFDPAFAQDGSIVALAPTGVVRVNPDEGGRSVIVNEPGTSYATSAISPDAKFAVVVSSITHQLDVFSIASPYANTSSYIGSLKINVLGASFISPTSFIVQTATTSFTEYSITAGKIATTTLATL